MQAYYRARMSTGKPSEYDRKRHPSPAEYFALVCVVSLYGYNAQLYRVRFNDPFYAGTLRMDNKYTLHISLHVCGDV